MKNKFLNNNKNNFIILGIIGISIVIFLSAYMITYKVISFKNDTNFVNRNSYESISKNNTRDLVIVSQNDDGEFMEKNRMKLELMDINKIFTDVYPLGKYEIIDFNDKSIVLKEKDENNFNPNMYYIGEKNGYITVFKSDNNGKLFIENEKVDISSKKVDSLPVSDRNLVLNYQLSSDNRDEMQYILSELET
ncbi:hypothetical protein SFBM_0871 [Candidatus Arthromitus sp. SFB-mouse-Japan]|uniref:hypothetical protein n=1 Tax=Candidatus Arthromitus sp. SFB-mouse TaxID=49118 RepID=UPI00021B7E29|nr:hypothetical protein [Candidatus Arthromitus sp. SFB-mouse]EIA22341.1 hypothetical protein SFB1_290G4 [Candidatus Arthromitus sp. SFB-1]EIA24890.1 hypothetical protein SFB2_052G8 [Candidatus Arthromitus sp. SFB-2]EIA27317.1 hypothetical protein SFB6_109G6 [Candidatus Arthromitus sp. SFB-co]EIA30240.1 hypothetical protein SFB4_031G9 [Candidatus Arthromitus sp. SFB-4]EIA30911.1 hypothetical protein SFBSU_006G592 [Candidatus Arthromitus sp. SFB-mouse-SU]EIA31767.1 hypothetical protein SFB5_00